MWWSRCDRYYQQLVGLTPPCPTLHMFHAVLLAAAMGPACVCWTVRPVTGGARPLPTGWVCGVTRVRSPAHCDSLFGTGACLACSPVACACSPCRPSRAIRHVFAVTHMCCELAFLHARGCSAYAVCGHRQVPVPVTHVHCCAGCGANPLSSSWCGIHPLTLSQHITVGRDNSNQLLMAMPVRLCGRPWATDSKHTCRKCTCQGRQPSHAVRCAITCCAHWLCLVGRCRRWLCL
jgi:hypothetical protein